MSSKHQELVKNPKTGMYEPKEEVTEHRGSSSTQGIDLISQALEVKAEQHNHQQELARKKAEETIRFRTEESARLQRVEAHRQELFKQNEKERALRLRELQKSEEQKLANALSKHRETMRGYVCE